MSKYSSWVEDKDVNEMKPSELVGALSSLTSAINMLVAEVAQTIGEQLTEKILEGTISPEEANDLHPDVLGALDLVGKLGNRYREVADRLDAVLAPNSMWRAFSGGKSN